MAEEKFSITNKTKSALPRVPFAKIKTATLGKDYSLSLVFIGKEKSSKLNFAYRGKNKPANILSFSLDKKTGEIFICPKTFAKAKVRAIAKRLSLAIAKKEMPSLFIHGLLHLKGMLHGSTMEKAELKLRLKFGI